jgi:hypothetical protein
MLLNSLGLRLHGLCILVQGKDLRTAKLESITYSDNNILAESTPLLAPWESGSGVVSLLDMQQYFADAFFQYFAEFGAWELKAQGEERETAAKPDMTVHIYAKLGVMQGLASMHDFNSIDQQCQRLMRTWEAKHMHISCGEARDGLRELRQRAEDDFKGHFFLHLTPDESKQYQEPTKHWEAVASRFYKVKFNIEESGKCFALGRHGAAVFHILQVAEYGVIQIGDLLEVLGDKPGWSCVARLRRLIDVPFPQRSPLVRKHSKLLENTLPLVAAMKDSWRHRLDHVDNQIIWHDTDFSPEVADEIIKATRGFMRKLAADLPRSKGKT